MKEWALKHPILTFLLINSIAYNMFLTVGFVAKTIKGIGEKEENAEEKEETADESCDNSDDNP